MSDERESIKTTYCMYTDCFVRRLNLNEHKTTKPIQTLKRPLIQEGPSRRGLIRLHCRALSLLCDAAWINTVQECEFVSELVVYVVCRYCGMEWSGSKSVSFYAWLETTSNVPGAKVAAVTHSKNIYFREMVAISIFWVFPIKTNFKHI